MSVDQFADECFLLSTKQGVQEDIQQGGTHLSEVTYSTDKYTELTSAEAGRGDEEDSIEDAEDFDRLQFFQHHFRSRGTAHRKYKYYVCAYILLCLLLIGAVIAFSVVVLLLLLPYASTSHYLQSACTVTSVTERKYADSCSCSQGCESRVPCVMIAVLYRDMAGEIQNHTTLHENDLTRDKQVTTYVFSCLTNINLIRVNSLTHKAIVHFSSVYFTDIESNNYKPFSIFHL